MTNLFPADPKEEPYNFLASLWADRATVGFAMADLHAVLTAAATSLAGSLATFAKDRSDRAALRKDIDKIKAQVGELIEGFERLKTRVKQQAQPYRGSDPGLLADLQRQTDDLQTSVNAVSRRLDEHDGNWATLQRELGGITAKLEILLSGSRGKTS